MQKQPIFGIIFSGWFIDLFDLVERFRSAHAGAEAIFMIDLVTVFHAMLTSRQTCEKLQCLHKNLMSNYFRKTSNDSRHVQSGYKEL